jgi:hypothetical protein
MDDIAEILGRRRIEEPDEIKVIKNYIFKKFETEVKISIKNNSLVISSPRAALINELRLGSSQLANECNVSKKMVFKIG